MKNPTFIQIDSGIYGDAKVTILMRKHGALGIALFLYSLIQINHNPDTGLLIDDLFMECAAVQHNADIDDVREVVSKLISLGLLYEDSGLYHSIGYDKRTGTYIEANIKRSETQKQNAADKAKDEASAKAESEATDQAKPQATAKAKPVVKQSLTPASDQFAEASEMIKRLRSYALAIFDEIGSSKNKPELTPEQYQKLIDKWGFDKLVVMQRAFYDHVSKLEKKYSYNHFNVLIKGGWVLDKVNKLEDAELDMKNGSGKW